MSLEFPKNSLLYERAKMLSQVRSFFLQKNVTEVDPCALIRYPSLDAQIDVMRVEVTDGTVAYLHTSPEYAMKRMLVEGAQDIFFLGHVFRKNERGRLHHPEFTMIEWYRLQKTFYEFIEEACDLIKMFLGDFPVEYLSYRDALLRYARFDPFMDFEGEKIAQALNISTPDSAVTWDRDMWLSLFMTHSVEPHLGRGHLTVLCDYPPSQAALAQIVKKAGIRVAERFEIYFDGIELANGYHELANPEEQRKRFEEENLYRKRLGKEVYPVDEDFLKSLKKGMPDACGASIGFDRLMLIKYKATDIKDTLFGYS